MGAASSAIVVSIAAALSAAPGAGEVPLDVRDFRIIPRESGKVDYYRVVPEARPYIRAEYKPAYDTAVLGVRVAEGDRERARSLKWSWRAVTLPSGGNECANGKGDSAAVVYATWKRGLRYYTLKYVWSAVGPKGAVCDQKRNPFVAQDTVVLESGGPLGEWRTESIDLKAEFRKHFENGDPNASVPDFLGVAIMTDGDQTKSESVADYADFVLGR